MSRIVLLILLLGAFAWAIRQPGGVGGVVDRGVDNARGVLDDATAGNSDGVVDYLQDRYNIQGRYPVLSEADQNEIKEVNFSGVIYQRCHEHYVVVSAITARGTVSRLLVSGEEWGTVDIRASCPASIENPLPWKVPEK